MKNLICMLLCLALAFSAAACGLAPAAPAVPVPTAAPSPAVTPAPTAAGTAGAEEENTVTVCSSWPEEMLDAVAADFEDRTGIRVRYVGSGGDPAERVRSEGEEPRIDVLYGGDSGMYAALRDDGLLAPSAPSWGEELADGFKAPDGTWYGTVKTPVLLFYNREVMDADEAPKDWDELTRSEYRDRIAVLGANSPVMRAAVESLIGNIAAEWDEETAWQFLRELDANIRSYCGSDRLLYDELDRGEAALSWDTLGRIVDARDRRGIPLEIIEAASGSVILTDCVAVLKNAPHPEAAAAFLAFVGSPETQVMLAERFGCVPTLRAALPDSPAWMQTEYDALPLGTAAFGSERLNWLKKWESDVIDADKIAEET